MTFCLSFVPPGFAQFDSTPAGQIGYSTPGTPSERYWRILTRNPRAGTALDSWYRDYVDRGRMDELLDRVQRHVDDSPEDANAHILYGLVANRLGQLDNALQAFATAAKLAPDNYYPCLLEGQALAQLGRDAESIEALERAAERLEKGPRRAPREELLGLYRQLGRAQLKRGQTAAASQTWQQLGQLFERDKSVQAQVAKWLQDERQWEAALAAWERVRQLSTEDPYTELQAKLAIAAIHAARGNRDDALRLLDEALDEAKPDSWTDKDIRRQIGVLLGDGTDALLSYLRERVRRRPEELVSIRQLSMALADAGDKSEAIALLQQAVERAPSDGNLRMALVEQLRRAGQFAAALEQTRLLVARNPEDVDILLMAGQLQLDAVASNKSTEAERADAAQQAIDIWRRIPALRGDDPQLAVQAAQACLRGARLDVTARSREAAAPPRQPSAGDPLIQAAADFYREAIRRADNPAPYYEYLAELFRAVGQTDEALAAWQKTVNPNCPAADWYHLARIYAENGHVAEAIAAADKAIAAEPDNASYRELAVELLRRTGDFERAFGQLDEISRRAKAPRKVAETLETRLALYEESGTAEQEIEKLVAKVAADNGTLSWQELWMLGDYYSARRDHGHAAEMLERAVALRPEEPLLIEAWARACEASGDLATAARQYRQLADLEPHRRATHVARVVDLELQQGHRDEANQAADELFAAPGQRAQEYLQRAAIAKLLERGDDELQMLRQAVRSEPRDVAARLQLAAHLASRDEPREALEHYFQAYQLADDLDDKLSLVTAMAQLGTKQAMLPELLARLERDRQRAADRRVATICVAEAYRTGKDFDAARQQLDPLLEQDPDDVDVLDRLADVAAAGKDQELVIEFRRRIAELTDHAAAWQRLLAAYEQSEKEGREAEIIAIARRLLIEHGDTECFPALVDRHRLRAPELATRYVQAGLEVAPDDWRLTYRAALLSPSDAEAKEYFEKTLRLCLASPNLSTSAEQKSQLPKASFLGAQSTDGSGARSQQVTAQAAGRPSSSSELDQNLPVFAELRHYTNTYEQLRQEKNANTDSPDVGPRGVALPGTSRSRVPSSSQPTLTNDPFEAAVHSFLVLVVASPPSADEVLDRYLSAGGQPEWVGLRMKIIQYVVTREIWQHIGLLDRFAALRPEDPFAHLIKFYSPCPADSEAQKTQVTESCSRSYDWITAHDRPLAGLLAKNYAQQLLSIDAHDQAAELISQQLDETETIVTLQDIAALSLQVKVPEFRRRFLSRALELADSPGTIPEDLGAVLIVAFADPAQNYAAVEWQLLFELIEKYLGGPPSNARSRTVTSLATFGQGRPLAQLQGRTLLARNAYLSADQRTVIYHAFHQAQQDDYVDPFLAWMRDQASAPEASITRQVACGFALWLADKKSEALGVFEELVQRHPHDPELRLHAATAALECREWQRCFILLSHQESLSGSRVESDALELQTLLHAAILQSSNYDVGLACLAAALEHQSVPQLDLFFQERTAAMKPDARNGLPMKPFPAESGITTGADRMLSRNPHSSALVLSILDHAWLLDQNRSAADRVATTGEHEKWLDRLQTATRRQLTVFPRNAELRVLDILILLRNAQFDEARADVGALESAGRRHSASASRSRWTDSSVRVLALALLNEASTQRAADLPASHFIIENAVQGSAERARSLMRAFTHSLVDEQNDERTRQFWQTFFATLADAIRKADAPAVGSNTAVSHGDADPFGDVVELFSVIPASAVPEALHHLAKLMTEPVAVSVKHNHMGRGLQIAIHKANFSWSAAERSRALAALMKLIFPEGPHGTAELYSWNDAPQSREPVQRHSLGETAIRLAAESGRLDELRGAWDNHPQASSPALLALRIEAAAAAGDQDAVNKLVEQVIELRKSGEIFTPVWSEEIMARIGSDRAPPDDGG